MDIKTISITILAIAVAGVVLGASLPLVASIGTETVSVENEGAQWVRMAYITDNSNYSFSVDIDGDVTITNGASTQIGEYEDMIIYADAFNSIFISGDYVILTGSDLHDGTNWWFLGDNFTVSRTSGIVTVTENGDTITLGQPTWAYVPIGNGGYSSFTQGNIHRDSAPLVAVGSFAGVYCYNNYVAPDVGLVMDADVTSTMINSVRWALESDIEDNLLDFDPGLIDFDPGLIQPIDIDPIDPGNQIMSVPTPTYTDGDWGYDLTGSNATIVSYSGAGGDVITVPSTVGGYTVTSFGKGGNSNTVFDSSLTATGLVIPDSVKTINGYAMYGCSGFTGSLVLPENLEKIFSYAFYGCSGFTGALIIPSTVTNITQESFRGCSGFTSLVIPEGVTQLGVGCFRECSGFTGALIIPSTVTTISNYAFSNCSGFIGLVNLGNAYYNSPCLSSTTNLKEVLNLGTTTFTTTSYGLNADEVSSDILASNYVAQRSYTETVTHSGPTIIMLNMLPLIMALGLVIACGVMISRRW